MIPRHRRPILIPKIYFMRLIRNWIQTDLVLIPLINRRRCRFQVSASNAYLTMILKSRKYESTSLLLNSFTYLSKRTPENDALETGKQNNRYNRTNSWIYASSQLKSNQTRWYRRSIWFQLRAMYVQQKGKKKRSLGSVITEHFHTLIVIRDGEFVGLSNDRSSRRNRDWLWTRRDIQTRQCQIARSSVVAWFLIIVVVVVVDSISRHGHACATGLHG